MGNCVYVCVYERECVMYMCVRSTWALLWGWCVEVRGWHCDVLLSRTLFSETVSSTGPGGSGFQLEWLANRPQGSICLCFLSLRLQEWGVFKWVLGILIQVLILHKHFMQRTLSQALGNFYTCDQNIKLCSSPGLPKKVILQFTLIILNFSDSTLEFFVLEIIKCYFYIRIIFEIELSIFIPHGSFVGPNFKNHFSLFLKQNFYLVSV